MKLTEKLVKVTMVIEDPMTVSELLEEFSNFLAGCGFAKYKFEIVEDDDNG
jgi:hypothetical protein